MGQLISIVAIFVLLRLLLIRPQRQRQVAHRELISSVAVGDEILTAGGLYGHVRALGDEDDLVVEIAPGTEVRLARRAVAGIVPPEDDLDSSETAAIDEFHS